MDSGRPLILNLDEAGDRSEGEIGGKARTLGQLVAAGHRVPPGFCLTTRAYEDFLAGTALRDFIRMEIGRKDFREMRWEEIWDAALRIRTAFLAHPLPEQVAAGLRRAYADLGRPVVAVRSSAPDEDSAERSFAGLHESLVGVQGEEALLDAVRIVWASLWSDAALLYRAELGLDVTRSRMAVLVQEFVDAPVSGVGFGADPREPAKDRQMIEAVPGPCEDLVSGAVDPDRWILKRSSGEIVTFTPGNREAVEDEPVLAREDLDLLHRTLQGLETFLSAPPDLEWTGHGPELTLLQVRPVTAPAAADDERSWYLTLRPGAIALADLCRRVTEDLIPELERTAERFAAEDLEGLDDPGLAEAIVRRRDAFRHWQKIYKDEFIPFAHGVRRFGQYYNDAVQPDDPYEFVALLQDQPLLASRRNEALAKLARRLRENPVVATRLASMNEAEGLRTRAGWRQAAAELAREPAGSEFVIELDALLDEHLDLVFRDESLDDRPDLAVGMILQLAEAGDGPEGPPQPANRDLEAAFLAAVGPDRQTDARDALRIGRLSWRLRDDDNILMGRLENQLQHALAIAAARLAAAGRLAPGISLPRRTTDLVVAALDDPAGGSLVLPPKEPAREHRPGGDGHITPRQLVGQPAARGLAVGTVRVVRNTADFAAFRRGEVLVCDAIQPTMTHLVPLAAAIVERRGGMLIHGAIIARELGVPCVNGVPDATDLLNDGDLVTVDGHLGIVTVGPAEFDLEDAED
jgi:pyruvate,water dikinase